MTAIHNEELREIIRDYGLTRAKVAEFCMCKTKSTVDRWLLPRVKDKQLNPGFRNMPASRLKLLVTEIRFQKLKKVVDITDKVSHNAVSGGKPPSPKPRSRRST